MKKHLSALLLLLVTTFGVFGQSSADLSYTGHDKLERQLKYDLTFPVLDQAVGSLNVEILFSGPTVGHTFSYTLQDRRTPTTLFEGSFTGNSYSGAFPTVSSSLLSNNELRLSIFSDISGGDASPYLENYRVMYNSTVVPEAGSIPLFLVGGLLLFPLCKRKH